MKEIPTQILNLCYVLLINNFVVKRNILHNYHFSYINTFLEKIFILG